MEFDLSVTITIHDMMYIFPTLGIATTGKTAANGVMADIYPVT